MLGNSSAEVGNPSINGIPNVLDRAKAAPKALPSASFLNFPRLYHFLMLYKHQLFAL